MSLHFKYAKSKQIEVMNRANGRYDALKRNALRVFNEQVPSECQSYLARVLIVF